MIIFDTDVLIWLQKGNINALKIVENPSQRHISVQTYMELMQCANRKSQQGIVRKFLYDYQFVVLPFTQNIGHRASIYIEDFSLSTGMTAGDAIIAATAVESNLCLITGNIKHFKQVPGLNVEIFRP